MYILFDKKWNGKEYNKQGNLVCEFINGNGKGKEYNEDGNIIFEGEYKNGKRWNGKEKEYDVIGNLKYEREYKNGIKSKEKGNENKIKNLLSDNFTLSQNFRFGKKGPIPTYKIKNVNEFDDIKYLLSESLKGNKNLNCDDYVDKFINMFLGIEEKKDNTIKKGNKSIDLEKKSNEKQPNFKDNLKDSDYFSKEKYNGKGKEYDKEGNLIFEGEFKNGKRWKGILRKSWEKNNHDKTEINDGNYTGKEYYKGQIIFEGEFFLGKKWKGKKIFYDVNNNFLFKIDSHKNSFITQKEILLEIYSTYEGKSREKIQIGKEINFKNNSIFEGEFIKGEKTNGIFKIYDNLEIEPLELNNNFKNLIFESEFKNGGINGKGKEYNTMGQLIFEGEFKNGKRWEGKGEEYTNLGFEKFEGKYLNGERWIGKEFHDGNLIFSGEYKDNKKWNGIIKKYVFGNLVFFGEYKNGKKWNGDINKYKYGKLIFVGKYIEGKKNGSGKTYLKNGLIFEGYYLNGEKIGLGKEYCYKNKYISPEDIQKNEDENINIIFEGEYKNDKRWNGKGKECNYIKDQNKKIIIEREYINGKKRKKEMHIDNNGKMILEIDYIPGEKIGKGKEYNSKGNIIFEGEYLKGKRNGEGIVFDNNKIIMFKGEYINDKKWKGIEYNYQGSIVFEQEYKEGEKNEKIIMKEYYKKKLKFEGEALNGKKNGKGKEYFKNKLIFEGEYLNGEKNGFGIEYNFDESKFKGEFKAGKKWNGTGYYKNGEIDYEMIDGNGIIKEYYEGKLIYDGGYLNGKRHGIGSEYDFLTGKLKYKGRFTYGHKCE